jgi:hypothetical protein
MNESSQRVCVVVMEAGGEWPDFVERDDQRPVNWAVVPQQPDETPAELALRAARRVEAVVASGADLDTVVIAAGSRHNDEVFAARCAVARALIQVLRVREGSRLVFSAPATLPMSARHDLIALAGTLAAQSRDTALDVGVRFDTPRDRSQSRSQARQAQVAKDSSALA